MPSLNCDDRLCGRIREHLDRFETRQQTGKGVKQAAVAVTIVDAGYGADAYNMPRNADWSSDSALILTRRASKLKHHAGQWALPGGRRDPNETPEQTALRELSEEVGLNLPQTHVLGRLDDFVTRSGFVIRPVVIWGGACPLLQPNPDEVASIHRIPIAEFLRPDAPILHPVDDNPNPLLLMPVGDSWIAAPTAAIIFQFREVAILGKSTRVAHYEQPFFAWR